MAPRAALLAATLLLALAPPARGQASDPSPAAYDSALALLAAGDTTAALERLHTLTEDHPKFGPGFLTLGEVLTDLASEVERDLSQRREARKALDRAYRLMGDDPRLLLQYGLLLLKRQVRVDAKRVLDRAWAAADEEGRELSPADRARLHFTLGKVYEAWWVDWKDLIFPHGLPALTCPEAGMGGLAAVATACPEVFAEILEHPVFIDHLRADERSRMLTHFRLALDAEPGHVDAAVHLLGHLAEAGDWDAYDDVSRGLLASAPDDARAHLFRGIYLHERGRDGEAGAFFRRGIELLEPAERAVFADVSPLLRRSVRQKLEGADSAAHAYARDVFLASGDPSWLTEENERLLEHYARVSWAELMFAAPASGLRGWESDRGEIWIRYGRPRFTYQCCYGNVAAARGSLDASQRNLYWAYGPKGPVFVFRKQLTYRKATHTDASFQLAQDLAGTAPEGYEPVAITAVHPVPHQVARFRGSDAAHTRVEVYAEPPLDSLYVAPGASFDAGLFLLGPSFEPVWRRTLSGTRPEERPLVLTWRVELPPGEVRYGIEARASGPDSLARPLARERASLTVKAFPTGRLGVSDILLAQDVRARAAGPSTRAELDIVARRSLVFGPGEPLPFYFEIYGLTAGDEGRGRYEVRLTLADSTRRHALVRAARGVQRIVTGGPDPFELRWERDARVIDDVAIEYLTVEPPVLDAGDYALEITVRDLATGLEVRSVRRFRVAEGPP